MPIIEQVRGFGKTFDTLGESAFKELASLSPPPYPVGESKVDTRYSVYFEDIGRVDDTPVYQLDQLDMGEKIAGPAMIVDGTQTIVIIPGAEAVTLSRHLLITVDKGEAKE